MGRGGVEVGIPTVIPHDVGRVAADLGISMHARAPDLVGIERVRISTRAEDDVVVPIDAAVVLLVPARAGLAE